MQVLVHGVGRHEGQGQHPLLHVDAYAAGEVALQALSSAHEGHVIVLDGGLHVHSLVLDIESGGDAPVLGDVAIDAEAEVEAGRKRVLVHAAYGGGHAHRGRASYAVAEAQVVDEVVEQAERPCLRGRHGGQHQCQYGFLHVHSVFSAQIIFTSSMWSVLPTAPRKEAPSMLEVNTTARL